MNALDKKQAPLWNIGCLRAPGGHLAHVLIALMVFSVAARGCSDREDDEVPRLESIEVIVDPAETPFVLDGELDEGEVALTFDDGPADPETTRAILRTLEKYGVKAMFFQVGIHAESHPEITQEILRQGHSLGSHSWDHADLTGLPLEEAIDNIERGHLAVAQAADTGTSIPFFRFPFLASSEELRQAVQELGLASFHANIISEDHVTPDPDELLVKALAAVDAEKRGIILFHDIQPQTADMLDAFLHEIYVRGYRTVVFRPRPTLASLSVQHGIRVGASFFWPNEFPDTGTERPRFASSTSSRFPLIFMRSRESGTSSISVCPIRRPTLPLRVLASAFTT